MKEKRKEIKLKNGVGKEIKLVATLYIPGCRIDLDTSSALNLSHLILIVIVIVIVIVRRLYARDERVQAGLDVRLFHHTRAPQVTAGFMCLCVCV